MVDFHLRDVLCARKGKGLACKFCGELTGVRGLQKRDMSVGGEDFRPYSSSKSVSHISKLRRALFEWVLYHKCNPKAKLCWRVEGDLEVS